MASRSGIGLSIGLIMLRAFTALLVCLFPALVFGQAPSAQAQQPTLPSSGISPEANELIEIHRKFAPRECEYRKHYMEMLLAGSVGHATRGAELEKLLSNREKIPELQALEKRRIELLTGKALTQSDLAAISAERNNLEAFCPFRRIELPYGEIPAAGTSDEARQYVLILVPNLFVGWRLCEVYFPENRRGLEAAWKQSPISRLDIPELHAAMDSIRSWAKDGYGQIAPGSWLDQQRADPQKRIQMEQECARYPKVLERIEAALPRDFITSHARR